MYLSVPPSIEKRKIHIDTYAFVTYMQGKKLITIVWASACYMSMHACRRARDVQEKANRCSHMGASVYVQNRL
jgi:hypothetical protein